jgi:hypothetical protein
MGITLSNELHMLYLLSPVSLSFNVNWGKYHSVFNKLLPVEKRICEHIGIKEDLIVAYGCGFAQNETEFKREVEPCVSATSPVRLQIPSTGTTPLRHKLISQICKFQAFADLNS